MQIQLLNLLLYQHSAELLLHHHYLKFLLLRLIILNVFLHSHYHCQPQIRKSILHLFHLMFPIQSHLELYQLRFLPGLQNHFFHEGSLHNVQFLSVLVILLNKYHLYKNQHPQYIQHLLVSRQDVELLLLVLRCHV